VADIGVEGLARAVVVGGGIFGGFLVDAAAEGFGRADVVERGGLGGKYECEQEERLKED